MSRVKPSSAHQHLNRQGRFPLKESFWCWHRRIGLVAALFVLLLAVTGILINHADSLSFSSKPLPSGLRALFYQVDSPEFTAVALGPSFLLQVNGVDLFVDDRPLTHCDGTLAGAVREAGFYLVACANELQLYNEEWQLVERVSPYQQLPVPIRHLGRCVEDLCLQAGDGPAATIYGLDAEQLMWRPLTNLVREETIAWAPISLRDPPQSLQASISAQYLGDSINWERWLLDLHSGRFLGVVGPWLLDFVAILFIFSAITGFTTWWVSWRRGTIRSSSNRSPSNRSL